MEIWQPECPHCGARINPFKVRYGSVLFNCDSCQTALRVSSVYFWFPVVMGLAVSIFLGCFFHLSWPNLLLFTAISTLLISGLFGMVLESTFNPKIKICQPRPSPFDSDQSVLNLRK
jgi:hypothetical protein